MRSTFFQARGFLVWRKQEEGEQACWICVVENALWGSKQTIMGHGHFEKNTLYRKTCGKRMRPWGTGKGKFKPYCCRSVYVYAKSFLSLYYCYIHTICGGLRVMDYGCRREFFVRDENPVQEGRGGVLIFMFVRIYVNFILDSF